MSMTDASVNESQPPRVPGQRRPPASTLYRRVNIAFSNLGPASGQAAGQDADIAEMNPVRNGPETFPARRRNSANTRLNWDDVPVARPAWLQGLIPQTLARLRVPNGSRNVITPLRADPGACPRWRQA